MHNSSKIEVPSFNIENLLQSALIDFPAIDNYSKETKEDTINKYATILRKESLAEENTLRELDESTLRELGMTLGHARAISKAAHRFIQKRQETPMVLDCPSKVLDGIKTNYPTVLDLLEPIGYLPLPQVPVPRFYVPKTKFLAKNLPCEINGPEVDFTLLPGDLNDPTATSEVVKDVLDNLMSAESRPWANVNALIGGSAVGKTKALYDIASIRYVVFMNGNGRELGQTDIATMMTNIDILVAKKKNHEIEQLELESKCQYEIVLVCAARALALVLFLCQGALTNPQDWRNLQLNGLSKSTEYPSFLGEIHSYLRTNFQNLDDIQIVLNRISAAFYKTTSTKMCVAIDEANILVESHVNVFRSKRDPSSPRSLWTLIGSCLSEFNDIALILAGTTIGLGDQEILYSAVAKAGVDAGKRMTLQTNFRFTNPKETLLFINRIFTELPLDLSSSLCRLLPGRLRYITTFALYLEQYPNDPPEKLLQSYITQLKVEDSTVPWSIASGIARLFRKHHQFAKKALCELMIKILLQNGEIVEPHKEHIDWMIGGLCHLKTSESKKYVYLVDEPVVIQSILEYLVSHEIALDEYLTNHMCTFSLTGSERGIMLDTLLLLAIRINPFPSFLRDAGLIIPTMMQKPFCINGGDLIDFFQQPNFKVFQPRNVVGPDLVYSPMPGCLVLFANATTSTKKSVSTKKILDNNRTTQLAFLYTKRSEDKLTRVERPEFALHKFKVLEHIRNSKLSHVVRVHVVLPKADNTSYSGFSSARITTCNRKINYNNPTTNEVQCISFKEISIDIDSNSLSLSGLFTPRALENLFVSFPSEKPIKSWEKEEVSNEIVDTITLTMPKTQAPEVAKKRKQEVATTVISSTFLCEGCNSNRNIAEYSTEVGQCIYCCGEDELVYD